MKKIFYFAAFLSLAGMLQSCVFENDMDYPYIKGEFTAFEVEGQDAVTIDASRRTVSVVLEETADITRLKVVEAELSKDARFVEELPEYLDLSTPVNVMLQTYQNYPWTISATQPIERYVRCENQVGEAFVNEKTRTVYVSVTQHQSRKAIVFTDMKLGPEGSEIISTTGYEIINAGGSESDEKEERQEVETELTGNYPLTLDCFYSRTFVVDYEGQRETWTLIVETETIHPEIVGVSPWVYSADVTARFDGTAQPVMEYKRARDKEWLPVEGVEVLGTAVSAKLSGLKRATAYEVRISAGEEVSETFAFSTGKAEQIANMNFDNWYQDGKVWYPNAKGSKGWGTANKGAVISGDSSTKPSDFVADPQKGGKSAQLNSIFVASLAFAAGNIYTGEFVGINGFGAELTWGVPFKGRPKALKGYYAYSPKPVDNVKAPYESLRGTMDKCQILVMLTDWDEPFLVNTTEGVFVDQENDPGIIAYAKYESDKDTGGKYEPFELVLDYRRPDATPKYAVVIACASYKGDYFTGGVGSTMYVDEFEFVYE